ncbi:DUF2894 domain-containing protein [Ralstonia sp. A12]|uniref:DUF2894 domain-containing protein n=1 Tax=Ralstonia sp. A12 TaxID=1217052 RepID=UPI0012ECE862|nr:DUF2894 domain-containing protein [Ralstonia sp. A12]
MNPTDSSTQATLDDWRARGADRLNRVRFHFIEALHRRAASQTGEARRVLDERLGNLIAAYADDFDRAAPVPDVSEVAGEPARSALAELLADIASHAREDASRAATNALGRHPHVPAELKILEDVRETWSRVSAEKQLRDSLDQVPTNAGPLNSSSLVHRSLLLMREVSPEYLRQFLSYVDALSWLERMGGDGAVAGQEAGRGSAGGKSARSKSR